MTAIGLEDMRDRMHRPGVGGIACESLAADFLGAAEFAGLLEPEGILTQHETRQRIFRIPGRQDAGDRIAEARGQAEEEIGVMDEAQSQRIRRAVDEDLLPNRRGLEHAARRPRLDRAQMQPLAG